MATYVILDNIRSTHNVGSVFRTADAAGVAQILLCGHTPTPIDRFGRNRSDIAKVALGAEQNIGWEYYDTTIECVTDLKQQGIVVVGVEQATDAVLYTDYTPSQDVAFVFGNEIDGVASEVCQRADAIIEIPMAGEKESLNISVTVGIVLMHMRDCANR